MDQAAITLVAGEIVRDPYGGRYVIEALLGTEQSEAVYVVRDQYSRRNRYILREFTGLDQRERARLMRDGEPLRQASRSSWPRVYGVFEDAAHRGRVYLLMDYIPGLSLADICKVQPLPALAIGHRLRLHLRQLPATEPGLDAMTPIPSPVPQPARRPLAGVGMKKREKLLFLVLALLIGAIIGVSLFTFLIKPSHPSAASSRTILASGHTTATPRMIPSPSPTYIRSSSIYPTLAAAYAGTVFDLLSNEKTPMYLTAIQQNQGSFSTVFQGLGLAGPITGTVTPSGYVQFKLNIISNEITLVFDGNIKIGGDIAGSFAALNQHGESTGESGVWNVAAVP
jgi:hypothetical protein